MNNWKQVTFLVLCFAVNACSSVRADKIASGDISPVPSSNRLSNTVTIGNVDGENSDLFRPVYHLSNDEFAEGLTKALAKNGLLTKDKQTAKYAIDATISATSNKAAAWEEFQVTFDVAYKLVSLPDNTKVWEKNIETTNSKEAMQEGSVWKTMLFSSPQSIRGYRQETLDEAARQNVAEFLRALDQKYQK